MFVALLDVPSGLLCFRSVRSERGLLDSACRDYSFEQTTYQTWLSSSEDSRWPMDHTAWHVLTLRYWSGRQVLLGARRTDFAVHMVERVWHAVLS